MKTERYKEWMDMLKDKYGIRIYIIPVSKCLLHKVRMSEKYVYTWQSKSMKCYWIMHMVCALHMNIDMIWENEEVNEMWSNEW